MTDRAFVLLANLPANHPLRSMTLYEASAEYRNKKSQRWNAITKAWGIANVTYNQLGRVWLENNEWRA